MMKNCVEILGEYQDKNDDIRNAFISYSPKFGKRSSCENYLYNKNKQNSMISFFGKRQTLVYMVFSNTPFLKTESYSQATGSINKCFQVHIENLKNIIIPEDRSCDFSLTQSEYTSVTSTQDKNYVNLKNRNNFFPEIYFFGTNSGKSSKSNTKAAGVQSKSKHCVGHCADKTIVGNASVQTKSTNASGVQTKQKLACGASAGTCTGKAVSINDKKCPNDKPCPYMSQNMQAVVSHIKIGPKEPCPIHGTQPCKGTKCSEDRAAVKISSVNNPRRGVFELVVRRLNGAPLAKNELMLEWTPPPKEPSCRVPCVVPIICKSKCRMTSCKPVSCKIKCKPKIACKKLPCYISCKKACLGCGKLNPCPLSSCSTCPNKCSIAPCGAPCLRPCPVGRKKQKRCSTRSKIKPHRKVVSPCRNRSHNCPVVKCRSLPGPCGVTPCPPRNCCSVIPCGQKPLPCNPCSSCPKI